MANERNKTALEFETMLRRHLKSGGAPVAACAGFDFDAASAYLEDALGQSHRAGYESHLAGCAACRRHLIELSRLAQTAPHVAPQPSTVADRTPAWVRWRGVAAGWFDLSSWNSKWRMTGIAGAAFAILIAALGVQSWLQMSEPSNLARAVDTNATVPGEPSSLAPTPETSLEAESTRDSSIPFADQRAQSPRPLPTPRVGPSVGDIAVASAPSNESARLNQNPQSGSFDILTFNSRRDASDHVLRSPMIQQGQVFSQNTPTQNADGAVNARQSAPSTRAGAALANPETADSSVQSRITPPGIIQSNTGPVDIRVRPQVVKDEANPGAAPNTEKSAPESSSKSENEKSRSRRVLEDIAKRINPLPPLKPDIDREARGFATSVNSKSKSEAPRARPTPKPADDEGPKQLKHRIRDKVFVYHREVNMWFDQDYREATMKFRIYPLRRGTKEYEDVLAQDPQLKEFFDHGPILVVWKNKIYKVK